MRFMDIMDPDKGKTLITVFLQHATHSSVWAPTDAGNVYELPFP
jgi:hypothetical protein